MDSDPKKNIADRLKSLGVKTGIPPLSKPKPDSHAIDSVVAGSFISTQRGEVFAAEHK